MGWIIQTRAPNCSVNRTANARPLAYSAALSSSALAEACIMKPCQAWVMKQSFASPTCGFASNANSAQELAPVATLPSLVFVQVPLEVQWNTHTPWGCGPPNAAVAVLSHNVDAKTGAVSMDLRVVLSQPGSSPAGPSSTPLPQSQQQLHQSASSAAALQRANRCPGEVAAERRDSVCCHWKKGWCRYGDSCKFKHPIRQRGIGDASDPLYVLAGAESKSRFPNPGSSAPAQTDG